MKAPLPATLMLAPDTDMPNSPLAVLVYRRALPGGDFAALFERNGWRGIWHNGVYDYAHFHSNAHEALGIARGSCRLQLGGGTGQALDLVAGDCLVLPAGTGHRRMSNSDELLVVGAYPPGQESYDICRHRSPETELRISRVPLPMTDPVYGGDGALRRLWG